MASNLYRLPTKEKQTYTTLFEGFGTSLNMSTPYHRQIYEQKKRINQVIEDMLMMYVVQ